MTAWRLPDGETVSPDRGPMGLEDQPGFAQRSRMVADMAYLIAGVAPHIVSATDLGCGDGSILAMLPAGLRAWGYELGAGDVAAARDRGLDVRQADILNDLLEYGDLLVCSEVLEHLEDPVGLLRRLPAERVLIASSPSAETGEWHNSIHWWAWDLDGYAEVLTRGGWRVLHQAECDGGANTFAGVTGPQRFQLAVAVR